MEDVEWARGSTWGDCECVWEFKSHFPPVMIVKEEYFTNIYITPCNMSRKVRWHWKVWNSISLCWRRNRRQMPLLCQMLFQLLQCCVLWWHRSYESFRVPEDITIRCLIIQNIMWGRPGPEVTAVPLCVKHSCKHEYANGTESRHWPFTCQILESVSSFTAAEIDDYCWEQPV